MFRLGDLLFNLVWNFFSHAAIINPMYYFIECFRYPIYNGELPSLGIIAMSALLAVVTLIIGYRVFTNAEDDFVYYV